MSYRQQEQRRREQKAVPQDSDIRPTDEPTHPLAGLVVLDLAEGAFSPASRLFGDLGAEVIRVEWADTSSDLAELDRLEIGIAAAGKRILHLDGNCPTSLSELEPILRRTNLVIRSSNMCGDAINALTESAFLSRPELVLLDVSPFGAGNSFSHWQATDPVLSALSGSLCRSGIKGREPLIPPGAISLKCANVQMSWLGILGLYRSLVTGVGDRIDVSALDAAMQSLDPGFGISGSAAQGRPAKLLSRGRPAKGFRYPIFPCTDGFVRICILSPRQWQGLFNWMGKPSAFSDPKFNNILARYQSPELTEAIAAHFANNTRDELEALGQKFGVPIAGMRKLAECLSSSHLVERQAFTLIELPNGNAARVPNGVIEIDGQRQGPRPSQPGSETRPSMKVEMQSALAQPLQGLRVLDLGVIVVGAEQSRLLADMGADVVKIESIQFPDGSRQSYLPTGLSASFAAGHRNKRGLGLNLRHAEGKELFKALVKSADVVLSNFKPGTLESLGVGFDELRQTNPSIITVESSAYGSHGPWSARMGYGPLVRAAAGVTEAWRYPDDPASYSDSVTVYPDHVAGRVGAIATLALLIRRLSTERGGRATISQLEVMLDHFASEISCIATGKDTSSTVRDAPWGVFPCAGDDEWCAITVRNNQDWRRLAPIINCGAMRELNRSARLRRRAEIERQLVAWLSTRSSDDAMDQLQSIGIPAGRMLRVGELPDFQYFRERGAFRTEIHPYMEEPITAENGSAKAKSLANFPSRPAPLFGEHTVEVMSQWLSLDDQTIWALIDVGALEVTPDSISQMLARGEGRKESKHA